MGLAEHFLHGEIVRDDAAEHRNVPDVMACTQVVEFTWQPPLGYACSVDDGTDEVDGHGGKGRCVEGRGVFEPVVEDELAEWEERGQREGYVEGHADPGEVVAVEGWVPGQINAAERQHSREGHVGPATRRFAIEGRVFESQNRCAYQQRNAGVIDAGVALQEGLVRYAVHGVHDARAQQALAGSEEEDGGDDNVGSGAGVEVDVMGVEIEGEAEHDHEADEVGPDICRFVVYATDTLDACPVPVVEAVAGKDVLVCLPRRGQVFVADQTVLLCAGEGAVHSKVNLELDGLAGTMGFVKAGINDTTGANELLVYGFDAGVSEGVCASF